MVMTKKNNKRELMAPFVNDLRAKNSALIKRWESDYNADNSGSVNLLTGKISVDFCETPDEKRKWKAYTLVTSSFPWRGAVGRQVKAFIKCDEVILGMIHLTSPLAQMRVRDAYLDFENKWTQLQEFYNIETCIPMPNYSRFLTGKLLVYIVFSEDTYSYLENKYGQRVSGFEVTSLYGKSSMYNRIPFLKYLGKTDGMSAIYITEEEWKNLLKDYKSKFPEMKSNRIAPVKFQIVDKLSKWYTSRGQAFPFEYHSEVYRRGVYVGKRSDHNVTTEESISEWKRRWLKKRMEYIDRD